MVELVARRADVADALVLVLRATGASEDLEDVEDAQVDKGALAGVVHLRALDDDGVGGQVDAPREGGRAAQDLDEQEEEDGEGRQGQEQLLDDGDDDEENSESVSAPW